jgi:hypothetical protein
MEFPFEGIPTVPPRKDMDHLAFFCGGCRWAVATRAGCCLREVNMHRLRAGCPGVGMG